ncbi:hypothetical protein [Nonomuraea sp. NPDC050310]|uniref:hypothetical protein n=1 Tax=Nonomuraea sp. NPDC050310 TaxID=3154935 RepID=UPI0033ECDA15
MRLAAGAPAPAGTLRLSYADTTGVALSVWPDGATPSMLEEFQIPPLPVERAGETRRVLAACLKCCWADLSGDPWPGVAAPAELVLDTYRALIGRTDDLMRNWAVGALRRLHDSAWIVFTDGLVRLGPRCATWPVESFAQLKDLVRRLPDPPRTTLPITPTPDPTPTSTLTTSPTSPSSSPTPPSPLPATQPAPSARASATEPAPPGDPVPVGDPDPLGDPDPVGDPVPVGDPGPPTEPGSARSSTSAADPVLPGEPGAAGEPIPRTGAVPVDSVPADSSSATQPALSDSSAPPAEPGSARSSASAAEPVLPGDPSAAGGPTPSSGSVPADPVPADPVPAEPAPSDGPTSAIPAPITGDGGLEVLAGRVEGGESAGFDDLLESYDERHRAELVAAFMAVEHAAEPVPEARFAALRDPALRRALTEMLARRGRVLIQHRERWITGYDDEAAGRAGTTLGEAERAVLTLVLIHSVAIPRAEGVLPEDTWLSPHPTPVEELRRHTQVPIGELESALRTLRHAGLVAQVKAGEEAGGYVPGPQFHRLTPAARRRLQEELILAAGPQTPLAAAVRARRTAE